MATRSQTYQQRRKSMGFGPKVRHRSPSEDNRKTAHQRGYTVQWRRYRLVYLYDNPLCVHHLALGKLVSANVVDHITPHKLDMDLFWDVGNHQSLCKQCHDIKTATEDGAFGREVKAHKVNG